MQKLRVAVVSVLVFVALGALAWLRLDVSFIAHFDFIWDVLLGLALGAAFAWMPTFTGFAVRRNAATGMFWICGFLFLLVIFYQYMTLVIGLHVEQLDFLAAPSTRMRVIEGAVLGYCSFTAGRGKI